MITGGCLCGRVRYEARGEPLFCVRKAELSITGEVRQYGVRAFCPQHPLGGQ